MTTKRRYEDTREDHSPSSHGSDDSDHDGAGDEASDKITIRRRHIDPSELTPKQLDRVLKNRQAAQASRERKRAYVSELEASRDLLQVEAVELRSRVHTLELEKSALASQVSQLKNEFEELKALLFLQSPCPGVPKALAGVLDRRPPGSANASADHMALHPTDSPAKFVLHAAPSPLIKQVDHQILGSRRLTLLPLSARNHWLRQRAPLTLSLLLKSKPSPPGFLMECSQRRPRPSTSSSCLTTLPATMTWSWISRLNSISSSPRSL